LANSSSISNAPKRLARVGVQFEIDADGILHVLARDLKTGRQTIVDVQSAVDVDDADVQQMVEESVAHAFEDLRTRSGSKQNRPPQRPWRPLARE